ncbi:hypothetical protein N9N92_01915 [Planktomarina temperata]|nr:hypothetical protein [Planktomarina temperata]
MLHFFEPFELKYLNPTPKIYTTIFEEISDFSHSIGNLNITDVTSQDICLITPFVFIGTSIESYEQTKKYLTKNYDLNKSKFPSFDQCADFTSVAHQSMKVAKATVISLKDYDIHGLVREPSLLKAFRENNIYLLLAGEELYDFDFYKKTLKKDMNESVIVEIKNFFNEFKTRIISLPHGLSQSEINQDTKSFDFIRYSIPGVNYVPRINFKRKVCGVNTTSFWFSLLYQLSIKLVRRLPFSRLRIFLLRIIMYLYIKHSKFSFTCGGTPGFFVRKFLEIPAAATVMICPEYTFFKRLGVHKYLNYIPFDPIEEDLGHLKSRLQKQSQVNFNDIIKNTQRLLQNKHSTSARTKQLQKALFQIKKNDFMGSFWEDGEFIIRTNNDPK